MRTLADTLTRPFVVRLQGLLLLLSPSTTLIVRKSDRGLATKAAEAASEQYKEISGRTCVVSIDESEDLPADSAGGVKLAGAGGRVKVNNTLDERLGLLEDKVSRQSPVDQARKSLHAQASSGGGV